MKKSALRIALMLALMAIFGSPAAADSWKDQRYPERAQGAREGSRNPGSSAKDERKRYREDRRYRSPPAAEERSRSPEGGRRRSASPPGEEQPWWESGRGSRARRPDKGVSLDSAVDRIRSETGARILSTDTIERDGRRVHEIKILTEDGRVRRMQVDGESGEVLGRPSRRSFR